MKKERRKFEKEFKIMAVKLCQSGKPTSEVTEGSGLRTELVSRWKIEYQQRKEGSFSENGKPSLTAGKAETAKLKKQLREAGIERDILKKAVSTFSRNDGKSFQFMKGHQQIFAIKKMCRVFEVSRSGHYNWLNRKPSAINEGIQEVLIPIRGIYNKSKGRYGNPKTAHEL